MEQSVFHDRSAARRVLAQPDTDLPDFVSRSIHDKTLSALMARLNHDVLHGSAQERSDARAALSRLGFI